MTISIYLKPMRCIGKKQNETALPFRGDQSKQPNTTHCGIPVFLYLALASPLGDGRGWCANNKPPFSYICIQPVYYEK
jgi:hypothetical protein